MTLKAISLFSGAGGDTLGMANSGIEVVGFIENNTDAILTHERNFPNCNLIKKDITKVVEKDVSPYKDKIDIIFGGFPCQSFSHGGKKNPNDKRGFLYQEFVRLANIIKPKIIIGENVKGILSRTDEDGNLFIDRIRQEFSDIGYNIKYATFNMKNYGIPQDRCRVIIYGIKTELTLDFNLKNIRDILPLFNKDIFENSLNDALHVSKSFIIPLIKSDTNLCINDMKGAVTITGKPPTNLVKCVQNNHFSYKKRAKSIYSCIVDRYDVARTILCTYGRMPRLFVSVKSKKEYYLRPYTILELARIQGFPDDFAFCGTQISKIKQIGNAIPPPFVTHIMNYIIDIIKGDVIEINT